MKTINKILLTVFLTVSLISSAFAGEVSVTGAAKASYRINSSDSTTGKVHQGKGLGISNELSFAATGELDNGWAWKWAIDFDNTDRTPASSGIDDAQLVFTTPMGTIALMNSEGSLRAAAYGWDVSAFGAGSDNGDGGTFQAGYEISSLNNIQYHTPADMLPLGIVAKIAYAPTGDSGPIDFKSGGTTSTSGIGTAVTSTSASGLATKTVADVNDGATQVTISAAPVAGLTLVADYTDININGAQLDNNPEEGHASAKYAVGPVTVGYGKGWIVPAQAKGSGATGVEYFENTSMGIGFKVNDAFSVSYTQEKSQTNLNTASTNETQLKVTSVQAAYNIGGATLAISQDNIDNANYQLNSDQTETMITLVMAF